MSDGVNVSLDDMYRLLLSVDTKVTSLATGATSLAARIDDHENRLRSIEAEEDNTRRLTALEASDASFRADLESLKVRVYAVPGAGVLVALAAVVITLIRTY